MENRCIPNLDQFLTPEQIRKSRRLYQEHRNTGTFAKTVSEEIITPNIEEINRKLGQENLPMYLAYVVEYFVSKEGE